MRGTATSHSSILLPKEILTIICLWSQVVWIQGFFRRALSLPPSKFPTFKAALTTQRKTSSIAPQQEKKEEEKWGYPDQHNSNHWEILFIRSYFEGRWLCYLSAPAQNLCILRNTSHIPKTNFSTPYFECGQILREDMAFHASSVVL